MEDVKFLDKIGKAPQASDCLKRFKWLSCAVEEKVKDQQFTIQDAYSLSKGRDRLTAKLFRPFEVTKLMGKNASKLDHSDHPKINPILDVSHTTPFLY